nr:hypothetical protein [Tanacetum cinerariifolium]
MARQYPKPKRKIDTTGYHEKVLFVEAQGNGKVLNEEELEFLIDFVLMDNLSSYRSYLLSKVPISDNTNNDMLNQSVSVKVNSFAVMNDYVYYVEMCNKCLKLEAKLIKQHNMVEKDEKLKGKEITDNAATIALEMYKLDPVILSPKVKNNREAHEYYLKHPMEQAAILREVVEQAKSQNPLDSASYSACMYVKLIQEFLGYIRDTSLDIHKPVIMPINKKKIVRFADTVTSSSNIPKVLRLFVLYAMNVYANHAMCLIVHVNSMNVYAKSASKKYKKRKEWKPTGKVFNFVGYKWKPTGWTFTLVGNASPLTRITATNKVPFRVPIPIEVVAPKHVVTRVYTRRPKLPKSVHNNKPKVVKSMTSNRMEPGSCRADNCCSNGLEKKKWGMSLNEGVRMGKVVIGSCVSTFTLEMQVTLHDKRIVMQVTLHYEAIVMQVTLHDKRIVMQVTLHYEFKKKIPRKKWFICNNEIITFVEIYRFFYKIEFVIELEFFHWNNERFTG